MFEIVSVACNVRIDVIDTEYESFKQRFDRLPCQYAELIIRIQPRAFCTLAALLADMLVGSEIPVHWTILQVHAGHHQQPRVGQGFNNPLSHAFLRRIAQLGGQVSV